MPRPPAISYAAIRIILLDAQAQISGGQEGYVVSAVLGLLAFLLGFAFSLATDRFETRRHLVLEESNAIGTAFLRAQLLGEPHRARLSDLLVRYTENKIALARAQPDQQPPLLAIDDKLITEIWAATAACSAKGACSVGSLRRSFPLHGRVRRGAGVRAFRTTRTVGGRLSHGAVHDLAVADHRHRSPHRRRHL